MIRGFANQVEGEIKGRYTGPAKIEDIQNLVEHALIDAHLYDVARAYTNYRLDKDIQRAKATDVNEAVARFINHDPTLIHENANKDSNVYSTSVICWPVPCPRPPRSTCCRRRCPTPT